MLILNIKLLHVVIKICHILKCNLEAYLSNYIPVIISSQAILVVDAYNVV